MCIFSELKRNLQKIPTSLGGGKVGYLALILRAPIYNALPGAAAFLRPMDPGPFLPTNARATGAEIATEKAAHNESRRLCYEANVVKNTLRNQIVKAIELEYIDRLRDSATDMINNSIPDIIDYLQSNYGEMTLEESNLREKDIENMILNPSGPPSLIFTKIKKIAIYVRSQITRNLTVN